FFIAEDLAVFERTTSESFVATVQHIVSGVLNKQVQDMVLAWKEACIILDFDMQEVYQLYIGKNVLNEFRRINGYKEGTYIKDWSVVGCPEDNDYLLNILN